MHILGFNCFAHDAAAAIVRDGTLLGLVEEERFLRRKHVGDFPRHAIQWCCQTAQIEPSQLDHIVFYWDPKLAFWPRLRHVLRYFPRSLELIRSRQDKESPMRQIRQMLTEGFGIGPNTQLHFAEHHVCHAASSFLSSPFDEAAILTIDAVGEWDCTWLGRGKGLDMTCIRSHQFPHSIGLVYGAVTEFLGHCFASGEGKVMGLASYGDPERYLDAFRDVIRLKPDGQYDVNLSYFSYHYRGRPKWFTRKFFQTFGPPCENPDDPDQRAMDIAAAIQRRTEEVGLHLARWLHEKTGLKKLCLAGGVCLNSVMNGRILLETPFDDVTVQPAANDAGAALGGCFWLWNTVMRRPRTYLFEHAYFGPSYDDEQVKATIDSALSGENGVEVRKVPDAPALAARLISDQKIIGWFQGAMEMGPRALGNRSIITDPRGSEMKDLLNARVKFREAFRPFAPSVLEERSGDWFESDYPSPYMILVYDVRPEKRKIVPAITHVDGTGRVQTVNRKHNPRYFKLIEEFEKITGVPIVLNTSFNIRGKPIVNTPHEAIECFMNTGMDALFLNDYLLTKREPSVAKTMTKQQLVETHAAAAAADNRVE